MTSKSRSDRGESYFVLWDTQTCDVGPSYGVVEFQSLAYAQEYINKYPGGEHRVLVGYELKVNK